MNKKIADVGNFDETLKTIYDSNVDFVEAKDEDGTSFLILYDWNDVRKIQKIINPEFEPKDEYDTSVLDNLKDVGWGFADEWSKCDECEKLIRTSPDSYSFVPDYWLSDEHGLLCGDCVRNNHASEYAQTLINEPRQANTILSNENLEELGFTLIDKDFESGWYDRHDSPEEILNTALEKHPEGAFLFSISGQGQFATQFELWGADIEEKDDEEEVVEESKLEETKLPYGVLAWKLGEIMQSMNNEEAYFDSGWLYIWPDGESREDCMNDFGDKESFEELKQSFEKIYSDPEYHGDGLYTDKQSIVDYAHQIDKKLGLEPIKNFRQTTSFPEQDDDEFFTNSGSEDDSADFQNNMKDDVDDDSSVDDDSIQVYEFPSEFKNYLPEVKRLCKEHDLKFLGKGKNVIDDADEPDFFVEGRYADLVAFADEFDYELHPDYLCSADDFAYDDILVGKQKSMKESTKKDIENQRDIFRAKTKGRNSKDWTEKELIEDRELSARSMMISILVYEAETDWSDEQFNELFEREIKKRYLGGFLNKSYDIYPAITKERMKELWNDMVKDFKQAVVKYAGEDSEGVQYNNIKYLDESLKEAVETKQGFTKEEATQFAKELTQKFFDDGGYYDIWADEGAIQAQIYWGDWKHDHLYFKSVVQKFFDDLDINIEIDSEVTEEDGSDAYSALHTIRKV